MDRVTTGEFLRINCKEWFDREDFMACVNENPIATWHNGSPKANDFSDVFLVYDSGVGCVEFLPQDIQEKINAIVSDNGLSHCLIWLAPLRASERIPQ